MFVLARQILNSAATSSDDVGAIANNVISIAVLVAYLLVFGPTSEALLNGPYTSAEGC